LAQVSVSATLPPVSDCDNATPSRPAPRTELSGRRPIQGKRNPPQHPG
jgi:hypothetical protein